MEWNAKNKSGTRISLAMIMLPVENSMNTYKQTQNPPWRWLVTDCVTHNVGQIGKRNKPHTMLPAFSWQLEHSQRYSNA